MTGRVDRRTSGSRAGQQRTEAAVHRPAEETHLTKLMTVDDVADYLNKPRSWVYGNWKDEKIPFRKVGQSLRPTR